MSKTTNKFAPEVRERAVRMVRDHALAHEGLDLVRDGDRPLAVP